MGHGQHDPADRVGHPPAGPGTFPSRRPLYRSAFDQHLRGHDCQSACSVVKLSSLRRTNLLTLLNLVCRSEPGDGAAVGFVSGTEREHACADAASNAVSDAKGRVPAFNLTLAITAVFAGAAAFAPSFGWLCCALFWVGTGIGGSMPTDGTLYVARQVFSASMAN